MDDLISLENLIELAKKQGVDFGKGDPYNRLRYYTKIGWLPHMTRKKDDKGGTSGHYSTWALERLVLIEDLKAKAFTNEEISKKLKIKTKLQVFLEMVRTKETRNQIVIYGSFIILVLILANEVGVVSFGGKKSSLTTSQSILVQNNAPKQVIDSGTAFIPKNQKKLFIQTPLVKQGYKVYITFTQDYSPAVRYWVAEIQDYKGFSIELDTLVFTNSEFTWWITN